MAQVFLEVFTIFCGAGGAWISPFIMPLINPVTLISCFIPIMLSVMFINGNNFLNSDDDGKGNKTKNWSKGSGYAFLIYYLIFLSLACSIMQTACKVGQSTGLV